MDTGDNCMQEVRVPEPVPPHTIAVLEIVLRVWPYLEVGRLGSLQDFPVAGRNTSEYTLSPTIRIPAAT